MDEILNKLHGSRYFSALDLKWGYWQVPLAQAAREMTAFTVGPLGFYEFLCMPFGLTNAPSTFQRLMETAFNEVHHSWILIYLDDIIIPSSTVDEQIARLRLVFQKLQDTGLKLKPSKCQWFLYEVRYLGHIVSAEGISTDPDKIAAVAKWPVPVKAPDLRSFLGFTSYYRRFIKNYLRIAKPLHELVANVEARHTEYEWSEACQEAFDMLKMRCVEAPILAYPNFDKPFIVHTDTSGIGLGAILYQADDDGRERVIAYASQGLSKSEAYYPAHKFLALKWAVCEKFQDYLLGAHFTVHTDNNPLTYVLTSAKVDAMGQCWLAALSCHDFTIKYHAGKKNIDADALSRIGWAGPGVQEELVVIPPEGVRGMLDPSVQEVPVLETVTASAAMVADLTQEEDRQQARLDDKDWVAIQRQDDVLSLVMALLERGQLLSHKVQQGVPREFRKLMRQHSRLVIRHGVLYRRVVHQNRELLQLVVPLSQQPVMLRAAHDAMGHPGVECMMSLLHAHVFFPDMQLHAQHYIRVCEACKLFSAKAEAADVEHYTASAPFELLHMDFLKLDPCKGGIKNVLVVVDHFTRFAWAIPTRNQTAAMTAEALWRNVFSLFGWPECILSDQGANFLSQLMTEFCQLAGTEKLRTSIYHPQCNGVAE